MSKKTSSRTIALDILLEIGSSQKYAVDLLDEKLSQTLPDVREAALATELVYGTIRMRGTLDWIIKEFSARPLSEIGPVALNCLRLGIYQLHYLDKIPDYAAVNESVNLAKMRGNPGAGRFVNAILRKFLEKMDRLRFPERDRDPIQYIAVTYSCPHFLVERWAKRYRTEQTEDICRVNNIPPPLFVRTNTLKISRKELDDRLRDEGIKTESIGEVPVALRLLNCPAPSALPSFREGLFYVQDLTAMKVVYHLKPQQNENILDLCAAPGGKATFIAQQMQKSGTVIACDSDPARTAKIDENLKRLDIPNVTVITCDAAELLETYRKTPFDRVLVDAPCSNTGVLRRRVEARWRLSKSDFERLPKLQLELLDIASQMVKVDGVLLYNTCSIDPSENEDVARKFLSNHKEFRINLEQTYLPEEDGGDGGYIARFVRSA